MWLPVQKLANVPFRNFHSIRHFYASRLIEQGVRPIKLRELMGHHSAAFTEQTYGHIFRDSHEEEETRKLVQSLVLNNEEK
jgi:integrase